MAQNVVHASCECVTLLFQGGGILSYFVVAASVPCAKRCAQHALAECFSITWASLLHKMASQTLQLPDRVTVLRKRSAAFRGLLSKGVSGVKVVSASATSLSGTLALESSVGANLAYRRSRSRSHARRVDLVAFHTFPPLAKTSSRGTQTRFFPKKVPPGRAFLSSV